MTTFSQNPVFLRAFVSRRRLFGTWHVVSIPSTWQGSAGGSDRDGQLGFPIDTDDRQTFPDSDDRSDTTLTVLTSDTEPNLRTLQIPTAGVLIPGRQEVSRDCSLTLHLRFESIRIFHRIPKSIILPYLSPP